jgi:hypothetical protein
VLKVTHLPIVGAIWLFELVHHQVRVTNTFSSIRPTDCHFESPPVARFQFENPNHGPPSSSQQPSIDTKPTEILGPGTRGANGTVNEETERTVLGSLSYLEVEVHDLRGQVNGLSAQIAELTALIMAQQAIIPQPGEDESDEGA